MTMIEPISVDVRSRQIVRLPARRHLVLCPAIDDTAAFKALRLMSVRSGVEDVAFVALKDVERQGFIKTINSAFKDADADLVSYVAQDAFAGVEWLAYMEAQFQSAKVNFAAYNCGKWNGRIAAFGCARTSWVRQLYAGDFFYPNYISHRADNELTVIARGQDCFSFDPRSLLVEVDFEKPFRSKEDGASNFHVEDRETFERRFSEGFDGLVEMPALAKLKPEYLKQKKSLWERGKRLLGGT
ncbi:hypothetical protein [Donghicola tyrosinivorans]|uniref:Glycosyl transferase family 2 n=1 Tax=Donghicola tyrosinivorans TaxID=1652492 RepID=A0A2T0X5E3_9RHOB|nr:hypothetical protein [Donghicola tyrosinivorans]PRY94125.1 hypothetical protein CLV74_101260 [Donghicola tyrosinivorans]